MKNYSLYTFINIYLSFEKCNLFQVRTIHGTLKLSTKDFEFFKYSLKQRYIYKDRYIYDLK